MKLISLFIAVLLLVSCGGGGAPPTKTGPLSWDGVTTFVDGTCLDTVNTLAGYRVDYGPRSRDYSEQKTFFLTSSDLVCVVPEMPDNIGCGDIPRCSVSIGGLDVDTLYYLAFRAFTFDGTYSDYSNEVSK